MMKRNIFAALLLSLFSTHALHAQQVETITGNVDCGKVLYERPVTAEFELRNSGAHPLRILDVRTSCGCTDADYPKQDVAPGASFTVKLTFDSRMLGRFNKSALVFVNSIEKPFQLAMTGTVVQELEDYSVEYPYAIGDLLVDKNVLEFDDVNKGDRPEQVLSVFNNGTAAAHPALLHLPSYLTAVSTPSQLKPGQGGRIIVTLNSSLLRDYGLTQTTIYLGSRPGEKVSDNKEIPVSAVLLPGFDNLNEAQRKYGPKLELSAETLEIDFAGKKRKTSAVVITNKGRSALNINSLQLFTSGVKVTLPKRTLQPGESTKLKVTANREELKRVKGRPRVLMITNDPARPKVAIEIKTQ